MRAALETFLNSYPGGRRQFCEDVKKSCRGVTVTEGRLSQILSGERPSPELAIAIHQISKGRVPGSTLRPDLWRKARDVPVEVAA